MTTLLVCNTIAIVLSLVALWIYFRPLCTEHRTWKEPSGTTANPTLQMFLFGLFALGAGLIVTNVYLILRR